MSASWRKIRLTAAILTAAILTAILPAMAQEGSAARQFLFLPPVVAEINGRKITSEEALQELKRELPPERLAELPSAKLRTMVRENINTAIDRSIIEQKLKTGNLQPSPEMVRAEFQRLFNLLTPEKKTFLINELAAKNLTVEQYQIKASLDRKEQFRIAFNRWIELNFAGKLNIPDSEIEDFYRQRQELFSTPPTATVSQILIKKDGTDTEAQNLDKARTILARLRQGEDFGKLAEQFSDCSTSKNRKGRLGVFQPNGELPAGVENAAFSLKAGEISDIIDDKIGFFIIKVNARTDAGYVPYENMKEAIRYRLRDDKIRSLVEATLQQERAKMRITINL